MIVPKKEDFTLYQGATWEHTFLVLNESTGQPLDLSGCTAKLQARVDINDTEPVIDITGEVGGTLGQVKFIITPDMTISKTWTKAGYDAELTWVTTNAGRVDKLGYGAFKMRQEYTLT